MVCLKRSCGYVILPLLAIASLSNAQDIEFDLVDSVPDPTYDLTALITATAVTSSYNPSAVLASAVSQITDTAAQASSAVVSAGSTLLKRAACTALPSGLTGYPYSPDTASAFEANPSFSAAALAAPAPSGYKTVFTNRNASNNAYGYMGYTLLKTYDTQSCADKCNAMFGCQAINIYFERDPSVAPGSGCTDPASVTYIKCVFWGGPLTTSNANNFGQFQSQFQVAIAGSNAYQNTTTSVPAGYGNELYFGNAAINAPLDSDGADSYIGSAIFNSGPFNIQLCADACTLKSQYSVAHPPTTNGGHVQTCQFFNTYILYINSSAHPQGQYCAMYSESWSPQYATNTGQYRGSDHYLITDSYASSNSTFAGYEPDTALAVYQAAQAISYSSLQPYCSTLLGYTTPIVTAQVTSTIIPVTTLTTTQETTTTVTVAANAKRDVTSYLKLPSGAPTISDSDLTSTPVNAKRSAASTPAALTRYPGTVVASACSLEVQSVSTTSTTTQTLIITATPSSTFTTVLGTTTVTTSVVPTGNTCIDGNGCYAHYRYHNFCGSRINLATGGLSREADYQNVADLETCYKSCAADPACQAFDYNPSTQECIWYDNANDVYAIAAQPDSAWDSGIVYAYC